MLLIEKRIRRRPVIPQRAEFSTSNRCNVNVIEAEMYYGSLIIPRWHSKMLLSEIVVINFVSGHLLMSI